MRSTVLSLGLAALAAGVNAQSSTASSSAAIPTGLSSGCTTFLEALDSNSTLSSCLSPLLSAASAFAPSSNSSNSSVSSSTIKSTLSSICSATECDPTAIRYQLTSMYSSCGSDLTGSDNSSVLKIYDVLYAINPMRDALCTKDDSGDYCVLSIGEASSSASASASASGASSGGSKSTSSDSSVVDYYAQVLANLYSSTGSLTKRDDDASSLLTPNATTFSSAGLPFLFLTTSTPSSTLCQTCTRNIITAYTTFEQASPYALGINNSPLLGGQNDLYDAIESECGASFLSGAVAAAGGLSGGVVGDSGSSTSAASPNAKAGAAGLMGVAAALVAGFVSLL